MFLIINYSEIMCICMYIFELMSFICGCIVYSLFYIISKSGWFTAKHQGAPLTKWSAGHIQIRNVP